MSCTGCSTRTEMWRPLVSSMAGNIPVDFLMAWIQKESDGDPCSWTSSSESGVFQYMPPDNLNEANTTLAQQHPVPPCSTSSGHPSLSFSDLTPSQQNAQIQAGITFVNYCVGVVQTALDASGADPSAWDPSGQDFWRLVKLVHAAPAYVSHGIGLVTQVNGQPPASWDEFRSTMEDNNCWQSSGSCCPSFPSCPLPNAEAVGAYGGSAPDPSILDILSVATGGPVLSNYFTLGITVFAGLVLGVGLESFLSWRKRKHS